MNKKYVIIVLALIVLNVQTVNYFCSGFCLESGCDGFTSSNCNNACSINWIPSGTTCDIQPNNGRQIIDFSDDAFGMMTMLPNYLNSSCVGIPGISYYG